mgnify:CR=1 FL=1
MHTMWGAPVSDHAIMSSPNQVSHRSAQLANRWLARRVFRVTGPGAASAPPDLAQSCVRAAGIRVGPACVHTSIATACGPAARGAGLTAAPVPRRQRTHRGPEPRRSRPRWWARQLRRRPIRVRCMRYRPCRPRQPLRARAAASGLTQVVASRPVTAAAVAALPNSVASPRLA